MGNLDSNNKPEQAIQKASPDNKTYQEVPPGTNNDIQEVCFFTIGEKRFRRKRTELIILVYVFGDCVIGVVQNITFQMFNRNIILQNNFIMRICSSPIGNPAIEKADFNIRIPLIFWFSLSMKRICSQRSFSGTPRAIFKLWE